MIVELLADCQTLIDLLNTTFGSAEQENQQGIMDFLASRIDAMGKHRWMLKTYTQQERS